jgi:hypothetical protein
MPSSKRRAACSCRNGTGGAAIAGVALADGETPVLDAIGGRFTITLACGGANAR